MFNKAYVRSFDTSELQFNINVIFEIHLHMYSVHTLKDGIYM